MTGYAEEIADDFRDWDDARPRTRQKELGWSNMADCRAYMGYRERGEWPTDDSDNWRAIDGTALHDLLTQIRAASARRRGITAEFGLKISYGGVPGHIDEMTWPAGRGGPWIVTDWKFPRLASIRMWADDEFLDDMFIQPQGYAAGAAGLLGLDPALGTVRLFGGPVDGKFSDFVSHDRPFDRAVADRALDRYAYVREAVAAGESLPRDKPFYFCRSFCEFVSLCRGWDIPAGGPLEEITDKETAAAIEAYGLAGELIAANTQIQKELRPLIEGVRGTARGWRATNAKPGPPKPAYDSAAIDAHFGRLGVTPPMKWGKPPKPAFTVTREKK